MPNLAIIIGSTRPGRAGLLMPDVPGHATGPPGPDAADHPPPDDDARPF